MDKKGAINLSINMIIVLILAIIILGFALSFVTKMFRQGEVALTGQFPEIKIPVTRDKPIGIGDTFLLQDGETRKVSLKIFNTGSSDINTLDASTGASLVTFNCQKGPAPGVETIEPKVIKPGDTGTVKTVIIGSTGMEPNDICTISAGGVSSSFFLDTE